MISRLSLRSYLDNSDWGILSREVMSWLLEAGIDVVLNPLKMPEKADYMIRERIGKPFDGTPEVLIGPAGNMCSPATKVFITKGITIEHPPLHPNTELLEIGERFPIGYSPEIFTAGDAVVSDDSPEKWNLMWETPPCPRRNRLPGRRRHIVFGLDQRKTHKNAFIVPNVFGKAFGSSQDASMVTLNSKVWYPWHEMAKWYQSIDCYLSCDPNGLGMASTAAMASGCLVLQPVNKMALRGSPARLTAFTGDSLIAEMRRVVIDVKETEKTRLEGIAWAKARTWDIAKRNVLEAVKTL